MSDTLLRFGLWILAAVLGLYILGDLLEHGTLSEFANSELVLKAGKFGILLVIAGIVVKVFAKLKPSRGGRCATCGRKVSKGSIYCPQHLRTMLEEEDWKDRTLSNVRRPEV